MEQDILKKRYEFTPEGRAIIDLTVENISDLFNSFDKRAVYTRRELDQDFVEYIVDCVKELGREEFEIRISIEKEFNVMQEHTLRKAIVNHFSYLYSIEHQRIKGEFKLFLFLTLLGVALAFLVYKLNIQEDEAEVWLNIFYEGIVVAMWVAFWEAITSLIFGFRPYYKNRRMYSRIIKANLAICNAVSSIMLP
jgi:hypothetical protein